MQDTKTSLRTQMLERLRSTAPEERDARSVKICERVLALPVWRRARVVAAFEPMRTEPHIGLLIDDLRTRGGELITILPSARKDDDVAVTAPLEIVLVPGLAFTRDGGRLGRGGGFFDRFLHRRAALAISVGVCFAFQILESLPLEAHDARLDLVVSD